MDPNESGYSLYLFKAGIMPEWEHPANVQVRARRHVDVSSTVTATAWPRAHDVAVAVAHAVAEGGAWRGRLQGGEFVFSLARAARSETLNTWLDLVRCKIGAVQAHAATFRSAHRR